MFCIYDLYDLSEIYKIIRYYPDYELNSLVLKKILYLLENRNEIFEPNQIRKILLSITNLDNAKYYFIKTQNVYCYFPSILKEPEIYNVLKTATKTLESLLEQKNIQQIIDCADILHNLPIYISEYDFSIPRFFWKNEVRFYRKKWDKNFLKNEEKQCRFKMRVSKVR